MARITQISGAVAVIVALAIYLYFIVWHGASGHVSAIRATLLAVLLGALGLIGAIGATIVLWRRRRAGPELSSLLPGVNEYLPPEPSDPLAPHPLNAPGPFYVVDGCCTACGVPKALAPELYAYDKSDHCYVRRQPETPEETDQAIEVMKTQELGCIRYRGTDAQILHRLADAGERDQCDSPLPVSK